MVSTFLAAGWDIATVKGICSLVVTRRAVGISNTDWGVLLLKQKKYLVISVHLLANLVNILFFPFLVLINLLLFSGYQKY